jgi:hypothetical protein
LEGQTKYEQELEIHHEALFSDSRYWPMAAALSGLEDTFQLFPNWHWYELLN